MEDTDITIISTGGTFNKVYNPITGNLEIGNSSKAVKSICEKSFWSFKIKTIINKDSLDMSDEDREILLKTVERESNKKIIIIHGTDTIDKSALFIDKNLKKRDKQIVLTGAMVPYFIDEVEAVANLALAVGFLRNNNRAGVYIAMHSFIAPYNKIYKDRERGRFSLN